MSWRDWFVASAVLIGVTAASVGAQCSAADGREVPSQLAADRWFVVWRVNGQSFSLYTDTGGGAIVLHPHVIDALKLTADTTHWRRGADSGRLVTAAIPLTAIDVTFPQIPDFTSVRSTPGAMRVNIAQEPAKWDADGFRPDGVLGSAWFADRVWTLDYLSARLLYHESGVTAPASATCWTPLGFQVTAAGQRTNHFPRVTVQVDGQAIEMLLDTGAQVELTASAHARIADDRPRQRGASFITQRRLDQWRAQHPDWRVVPAAEAGFGYDVIEVPRVEVGGASFGPVWFTARPNESFDSFMSQYMDRPIEGAIGGSALKYVRLILDYPRSRAAFLPADRD